MNVLLFVIFCLASSARAINYIVDGTNGSDDNDGLSPQSAFKTISKCVQSLKNGGDECQIMTGWYHEVLQVNGLQGSKDTPFKITGFENDIPTIDGTVDIMPNEWNFDQNTGICSAKIKQDIFALFLNQELLTAARWPNAKWSDKSCFNNSFWGKSDKTSERGVMVDDGQLGLAESGINAKGSMAILNIGYWNTFVAEVQDHKTGTNTFTYNDTFGDIRFIPGINQYYLEASLALLDSPEEWFYDKETKILYLIPPKGSDCPDPSSDNLRGRTTDYGLIIRNTTGLTVSNITFFAANIDGRSEVRTTYIDHITLENVQMYFGASSHRMLKSSEKPKWTKLMARAWYYDNLDFVDGKISVINCTFHGSEGVALEYGGKGMYIHNNLFSWNDWTVHLMDEFSGGLGTVYGNGSSEEFSQNTLWYNGASAGIRPGNRANVSYNHVNGQCAGMIMRDGAGIQFGVSKISGSQVHHNWLHDSPKWGIRFDDADGQGILGYHGTMTFNVAWNNFGLLAKGDNHTISNNIAFDRYPGSDQGGGCNLCIMYKVRMYPTIQNNYTITTNNGAYQADGGKDYEHNVFYPIPGIVVENNYSGTNVKENLFNAWIMDFRPRVNGNFTDGDIIGPYMPDVQGFYWIPGRKSYKTSTPIPPIGSAVLSSRDVLMFLGAYRADSYHWYFGTSETNVENAGINDEEYRGAIPEGKNVLPLPHLEKDTVYYWRVDTQWGGYMYKGDVWNFYTLNV